jgi:hypothetical protein
MFEDYYLNSPALQGLLAAAGSTAPAAEPTAQETTPVTPAVEPMTQEAASAIDLSSLDLSGLYGMNFGSDFGSGGAGGGIYPTNPNLQMFKAPLSSKGNPTAYGDNYISVTSPTQVFRLFDKNTGKVVYEGVGYEGAQEAINRASALTAKEGAKAQWQIQTPNPQQESGYSIIASEKRNQSTVGDIASVALPIGMALLTGGMSLPAQIAGAAMAGAAGAGLAGKDPLKAGLISGATAGLGNVTGANEAIGKAVGNVGGILAGKTAEELTKTAAEKAAEQIIVTGLSKAAQGAGSAIGNTLLSQAVKGGLSDITGYKTPAEKFAEQPVPETVQPPLDNTIVVSGTRATPVVPNYGGALAGVVSPIATEFLPKSVLPEPLPSEPAPTDETIVVTAPQSVAAPLPIAGIETAIPAAIGGALTAAQTAGTPPPADKGGVLGTGLNIPQLLSIGGIGADLLQNLLAGGGGGAGVPYVSQFGPGVGIGAGRDMRANPTILDYERYGFGPEAMFFQPGYGLLNSAGATPTQAPPIMAAPQAQPAMVTNPRYEPLI